MIKNAMMNKRTKKVASCDWTALFNVFIFCCQRSKVSQDGGGSLYALIDIQ